MLLATVSSMVLFYAFFVHFFSDTPMQSYAPILPLAMSTAQRDALATAMLLPVGCDILNTSFSPPRRQLHISQGVWQDLSGFVSGTFTSIPYQANPADTDSGRQAFLITLRDNMITSGIMAPQPLYAVSGSISGDVLSGVALALVGSQTYNTVSDAGGNFSFNAPDGTYTLTPSAPGYFFTPSNYPVVVSGGNIVGQDFVSSSIVIGNGIQPAPSLVLGHNYENNGLDVTGNFPLITTNGSPMFANNWSAQGQGLTGFNDTTFGSPLKYSVNPSINAILENGIFTVAWHLRIGANVGSFMLLGDGSTNNGVWARINGPGLFQFNATTGLINDSSFTFAPNTTYHIAVSKNLSTMRAYVNAVGGYVTPYIGAVAPGGTQNKIGDGLQSDWEIYDYGVWDIAMNSTQIQNIMNNQAP